MRPIEADWIREQLLAAGVEHASPIANIGSSTAWFRSVKKPHIEERLFKPLREAGFEIFHVDLKAAEGVDLVADLSEPEIVEQLRQRGFHSLICSNMLEHVEDPRSIAEACEAIIDKGLLIVTVPRVYPYHPDPIDTLYRPDPAELSTLFRTSVMRRGDILTDGSVISDERARGCAMTALAPLHYAWLLLSGLWRPAIARAALSRLRHPFRRIAVTCIVLERTA